MLHDNEKPESKSKKIVIIGSGGHGVASLYELLKHKEFEHTVYFNTGDWGGSWGLWGRLLEHNENELNKILHGEPIETVPFADINKAICHFINAQKKQKEPEPSIVPLDIAEIPADQKPSEYKKDYKSLTQKKSILDFRSDSLAENKEKFHEIINLVRFDHRQENEFQMYFMTAWKYHQKAKFKLKYDKPFCLGYLLHTFIFWQGTKTLLDESSDPMMYWNKFWQDLNILPRNVYLDFTSKNRQVMTAKNLSLEKLWGEDQIDSYYSPILPETMVFENVNQTLGKPKKSFLKILTAADLVIIPNGSVGNWLSVINYAKVKAILPIKKIVWLTNPYRNKNELINPNYVLYFNESGINVNTFVPAKNDQNIKYMNVLEQDKNGRYIPAQVAEEILKIL
jgi:hypothetical protein